MKLHGITTTIGLTIALNALIANGSKHSHAHLNQLDLKHHHHYREPQTSKAEVGGIGEALELSLSTDVKRRGGQCQFPTNAGLVAVTPESQNGGWAMSPNQPCLPGNYCPYACPPGQMMDQWDPEATSYTYPQSMNGGLYCDENGDISKPFPNNQYCVSGSTNIGVLNKAGKVVSFCQTVLPGNEAMLIPTSIEDEIVQLAIPTTSYWCGTAAHFYINPPGLNTDTACVWGTNQNDYGNWSPYVAGGNTDQHGNTFIKLAWNPIYLEPATPFRNVMPTWGVEIVCNGPGCNGLPCAIDPSQNSINEMVGSNTDGAGGANFCVVTVPSGVTANFVVFEGPMSGAGGDTEAAMAQSSSASTPSSTPSPSLTATPTPSSSTAPSTTTQPSSSAVQSTTSRAPSSSPSSPMSSETTNAATTETTTGTTTATTSSVSSTFVESSYPSFAVSPHVLLQNMTSLNATASSSLSSAQTTVPIPSGSASNPIVAPIPSATLQSDGSHLHTTLAGLSLFFVAAVMIAAA
ncbi:hypothetical protein MMC32_004737 [Xylographa parallela]|nr:hypothetical protein [Xylographa parallela]